MARNEEKAQALLNRFLASKQERIRRPPRPRPVVTSECFDLHQADRWRQQVLREIGKKVMDIQNAGLGEYRLRDLNDEINKLIREKTLWEARILELGGPDYAKSAPKVTDSQGYEISDPQGTGYRYFGAAKNLPGVKELFEREPPKKPKRTRQDLYKDIDGDYYGFRDEEDGVLLEVEREAEKKLRQQTSAQDWNPPVASSETTEERTPPEATTIPETVIPAEVTLPDEKEIERRILEKRKKELMALYASESLQEKQEEAKSLLHKK